MKASKLSAATIMGLVMLSSGLVDAAASPTNDSIQVASETPANQPQNDQYMWNRSGSSFYIVAQTVGFMSDVTKGSGMTSLKPGQTLDLMAYSKIHNLDMKQVQWYCNSSYATITPDLPAWELAANSGPFQQTTAKFVAEKPGIYTIQARVGVNEYTVPLVITVYEKHLHYAFHQSLASMEMQSGVVPLKGVKVPAAYQFSGNSTNPTNNWISVYGRVKPGSTKQIVACLYKGMSSNEAWDYSIPVNKNGVYASKILSPISGLVVVVLYPHYFQDLDAQNAGKKFTWDEYTGEYNVPGNKKLTRMQLDTLSTGQMDFSMGMLSNPSKPIFQDLGAAFVENSTSMDSAIEAINNYVSDIMVYNTPLANSGGYNFISSSSMLQHPLGVCQNYAELAVSILRAAGIPAETIMGTAYSETGVTLGSHEWVKAWNGSKWVFFDPTWSSYDSGKSTVVTNQYFTNTHGFNSTRTPLKGHTDYTY